MLTQESSACMLTGSRRLSLYDDKIQNCISSPVALFGRRLRFLRLLGGRICRLCVELRASAALPPGAGVFLNARWPLL